MKYLLCIVLFLVVVSPRMFAANDPYAPFPTFEQNSNGKGKGHPVVPEPAIYGVSFMSFALIFFLYKKGHLKSINN